MNIKVDEIIKITDGKLITSDDTDADAIRDIYLKNIATDSRKTDRDSLFIAFKGENVDGHRFLTSAMLNAPAALIEEDFGTEGLTEQEPVKDKAYIRVDDCLEALQKIGKYMRTKYTGGHIIGVTGSVGKTTTRELISHGLSSSLKVFHTEGNNNSQIGVPLTLSRILDEESDISVLEMGISEPGGMDKLTDMVNPDIAVVTNIGIAHIEFLKTQEGIREEKLRITGRMNPDTGVLFLNADDILLRDVKGKTGVKTYYYGTDESADYRAENIRTEDGMSVFDFCYNGKKVTVISSAIGRHNVLNLTAALGVADHLGLDVEKTAESFRYFKGQRQNIINTSAGYTIIDDTYNASVDSMKAAINVLCNDVKTEGRRVAVLGSMFELGERSADYHKEVGMFLKDKNIDELIIRGDEAQFYKEGNDIPARNFDTNAEAAEYLKKVLKSGDTVLLKASNGMKLGEIVREIKC